MPSNKFITLGQGGEPSLFIEAELDVASGLNNPFRNYSNKGLLPPLYSPSDLRHGNPIFVAAFDRRVQDNKAYYPLGLVTRQTMDFPIPSEDGTYDVTGGETHFNYTIANGN